MRFKGLIKSLTETVRGEILKIREGLVPNINIINHVTNRKSMVEEDGTGYIFLNNRATMLRSAINKFKEGHGADYVRIIAYRNKTIDKLTTIIRRQLYGKNPKQFEVGELVISDGGYTVNRKTIINNGETFKVVRAELVNGPYNLKCVELTLDKAFDKRILVVAEESKETYNKLLARIKRSTKADKGNWAHFHTLLETFAVFRYAFVLSSHRAQGSSIKYVYVLEDDILSVKLTTVKEKLQSLYVALSRASFRVYIYNKTFKIDYKTLNKEYLKIKPNMDERGL